MRVVCKRSQASIDLLPFKCDQLLQGPQVGANHTCRGRLWIKSWNSSLRPLAVCKSPLDLSKRFARKPICWHWWVIWLSELQKTSIMSVLGPWYLEWEASRRHWSNSAEMVSTRIRNRFLSWLIWRSKVSPTIQSALKSPASSHRSRSCFNDPPESEAVHSSPPDAESRGSVRSPSSTCDFPDVRSLDAKVRFGSPRRTPSRPFPRGRTDPDLSIGSTRPEQPRELASKMPWACFGPSVLGISCHTPFQCVDPNPSRRAELVLVDLSPRPSRPCWWHTGWRAGGSSSGISGSGSQTSLPMIVLSPTSPCRFCPCGCCRSRWVASPSPGWTWAPVRAMVPPASLGLVATSGTTTCRRCLKGNVNDRAKVFEPAESAVDGSADVSEHCGTVKLLSGIPDWFTDCVLEKSCSMFSTNGPVGCELFLSDTWCVSAVCAPRVPSSGTRSFKSRRNKPLGVNCKGMVWLLFLRNKVRFWVSITAPRVLKRVLDNRKGVDPGTIAILSFNPKMGTTRACSLSKMPWFPKRNAILQGHRVRFRRMCGWRLLIKSFTKLLPITVLVAPRSTTPKLPCVAKQVSDKGNEAGWDGLSKWHCWAVSVLGMKRGLCIDISRDPLFLNWRVSLNFPNGSLTKLVLPKTNSKRGSSMDPSWWGRLRNYSKGSWSMTFECVEAWT